jgi:serralysin
MCELCRAFGSYYGSQFHTDSLQPAAASGETGLGAPTPAHANAVGIGATGDQDVDGLLSGYRWSGTLTYTFPDSASDYPSNYGSGEPTASGFAQISAAQQNAVHKIMSQVESLTNLQIEHSTSNTADIRVAQSSAANPTAYAYYPNSYYSEGGDVWFGTSYNYTNPKLGDYYYLTHIHELGHALGLKHGQSGGGVANVALPADRDALEFSVMTYRSYVGGPTSGYTNEAFGYPQSFMMNDILALQTMYGADYEFNDEATVYSWSSATGETFVDDVGQGRPGGAGAGASANRVFITVWDGGGEDTYDLSNYTNSVSIDLRPGFWSITSNTQKAYLGGGHYAQGNVYNAYLFDDDARSYIENAIGGTGNDTLNGNAIANLLDGGDGNDTLTGGDGDDVFVYSFGDGADIVTDFVVGVGTDDQIDLIDFSAIDSFADAMSYAAQVGSSTVFDFGGGSSLTFLNVLLAAFAADDFTFDFAPDEPNEAPSEIELSSCLLPENSTACVVGNLVVTDPDGDTAFTFSVSDSRFQVVGTPGNYQLKLKAGISLDYEVEPTVTLTVTATDAHGLSNEQEFTIEVIDTGGVTIYGTSAGETIDSTRSPAGQARPTADEDIIFGMAGNDVIRALAGNDSIDGGEGNDTAYGNDGDDTIIGGAGTDKQYGENGDDTFVVSGIDAEKDTFSGGDGTDKILVVGTGDLTLAAFNATTSSIEILEGNGSAILGTSFANKMNFAGLAALTGVAHIDGAGGNDTITGSVFADELRGGLGNDSLYGGAGNDVLTGGAGTDKQYGENGDDTFVVTGIDAQKDTFSGGDGTDRILVVGTGELTLAAFNATTSSIEILEGNGSAILGTTSANQLDFSGLTGLVDVAYVDGASGNDTIVGSAFADDLRGSAGNDTIYGGLGDDNLTGGVGADKVYGEDGDDTFFVSGTDDQKDIFAGGSGSDTIRITGAVNLTLAGFDAGLSSIEVWQGNGQGVVGTFSANKLNFSGLTTLSDLAYVDGAGGSDAIVGSGFADDLRGGSGADTIDGGAADDRLSGGTGKDILTGGDGADRFAFSEVGSTNRDTILDYNFAENDMIDVSALLDANFDASSNVADFVRLTAVGQDLVLQVDVNGPTSGAGWSDVATLPGASAVTQVLVHFEQQAHTLSAA